MALLAKKWTVGDQAPADFQQLIADRSPLIAALLYHRGLRTLEEVEHFFDPHGFDPYLFKDMTRAVDRLLEAIQSHQRVFVYGDYDADGVCSSTVLMETLKKLGLNPELYIPFRETEGYGLNQTAVEDIAHRGCDLMLTVDCGVSNFEEIKWCQAQGIDVIVLDHHQPPAILPPAYVIINPAIKDCGYPFAKLCGAGVAFKFVQALAARLEEQDAPIKLPTDTAKWLLDIVAIATIGDIMPLVSENRALVKYGLTIIKHSPRPGIQVMLERINNRADGIDSVYISWRIVPRLNAAGRMDHASAAYNLLTAETREEAEKLFDIIDGNNKTRQQATEKMLKEALKQVSEKDSEDRYLISAVGDDWLAGLVGLVAGRVKDAYFRPTIIIHHHDDTYVGSGRSIPGFDITAALAECGDYLLRFGGHPQACGFTVVGEENLGKFIAKMESLAETALAGRDLRPELSIDAEVTLDEINWQFWDELIQLEPYGEGNPRPRFLITNVIIEKIRGVGADGKHLSVLVSQENNKAIHKLIGFSFGEWTAKVYTGDRLDIVFELGINQYNGNRELQLEIIDMRHGGGADDIE